MVCIVINRRSLKGKVLATGLDDGSVYVWNMQDGYKVRQVTLETTPQGPISCLNWVTEDPEVRAKDAVKVRTIQ